MFHTLLQERAPILPCQILLKIVDHTTKMPILSLPRFIIVKIIEDLGDWLYIFLACSLSILNCRRVSKTGTM